MIWLGSGEDDGAGSGGFGSGLGKRFSFLDVSMSRCLDVSSSLCF